MSGDQLTAFDREVYCQQSVSRVLCIRVCERWVSGYGSPTSVMSMWAANPDFKVLRGAPGHKVANHLAKFHPVGCSGLRSPTLGVGLVLGGDLMLTVVCQEATSDMRAGEVVMPVKRIADSIASPSAAPPGSPFHVRAFCPHCCTIS